MNLYLVRNRLLYLPLFGILPWHTRLESYSRIPTDPRQRLGIPSFSRLDCPSEAFQHLSPRTTRLLKKGTDVLRQQIKALKIR